MPILWAGDKTSVYDDVIKWKHFPRNWPFVRVIRRSTMSKQSWDWWFETPSRPFWRQSNVFHHKYKVPQTTISDDIQL